LEVFGDVFGLDWFVGDFGEDEFGFSLCRFSGFLFLLLCFGMLT